MYMCVLTWVASFSSHSSKLGKPFRIKVYIYKLHELCDENLRRLAVGSPACRKKWHINVLIFVQGDMMNAEINSQTQPNPSKSFTQPFMTEVDNT